MSTRIALRADASPSMGTGHFMRILVVADALRARGGETVLLSRSLPDRLRARAEKAGHTAVDLPLPPEGRAQPQTDGYDQDLDAALCMEALEKAGGVERLVVDHYELSAHFETTLRPYVPWIAAIDDLADRAHDCDVLLDQGLYPDAENRYARLVPETCASLLGPRYSLLREEFGAVRGSGERRDGLVHEILVFLGGGDTRGMTLRALEAIRSLIGKGLHVTVVTTSDEPDLQRLQSVCGRMSSVTLRVDVENMAELMSQADLSVGAGGTATWERCYLGLPTVFASFADNQSGVAREVAAAGAGIDLGARPPSEVIGAALRGLLDDPERVGEMGHAATMMMAGARVGRRHELAMRVISGHDRYLLRPVGPPDMGLLYTWRNSDRIRAASLSDHPISISEHRRWFLETLGSDLRLYYVFEIDGQPVGVFHLDRQSRSAESAAWGFYVGAESVPPGAGTAMCRRGLHEAFVVEGLQRVHAEVLAGNERSLSLHERLGFKRTGTRVSQGADGPRQVVGLVLDQDTWKAVTVVPGMGSGVEDRT